LLLICKLFLVAASPAALVLLLSQVKSDAAGPQFDQAAMDAVKQAGMEVSIGATAEESSDGDVCSSRCYATCCKHMCAPILCSCLDLLRSSVLQNYQEVRRNRCTVMYGSQVTSHLCCACAPAVHQAEAASKAEAKAARDAEAAAKQAEKAARAAAKAAEAEEKARAKAEADEVCVYCC
jgi:hypothetical protein